MKDNIYEFVKSEEQSYKTRGVVVTEGFEWGMFNHLRLCTLYKDGRTWNGAGDPFDSSNFTPIKNIILPILNVHYRTEGFDVKDIEPFVDSDKDYHKSFLVRKFHDNYALRNKLDTAIDESVESYVDYGGCLVKRIKGVRPEVIPLQTLAFCDQTDILSGPFAIKHQYSIDQIKEKSGTWDEEAVNEIVEQARMQKPAEQAGGQVSKTPGKYIEVYEVHGMFPKAWLTKETADYEDMDEDSYSRQIHIISLNQKKDTESKGITLFRGPEKDGLFKLLKRDKRFGTALGRSAIEELFESQAWTNYAKIQEKQMLDKAALMLGITDDPSFNTKNKFTDLEPGEWLVKTQGSTTEPFIFPMQNIQLFNNAVVEWENHARTTGSANEAALGVSPSAGTPFKLQELVVQEGRGMHEYRRGQIATFWEEIYRDWIIPDLVSEMNDGQKFLAELTLDELEEISERVSTNLTNKAVKREILKGNVLTKESVELAKVKVSNDFKKKGTRQFIEILADDLKDVPVTVRMNVAGKQKNLVAFVDKLTNIVRQVLSNPAILQDPNAAKLLNTIFEASGISPIGFKPVPVPLQVSPMQQPALQETA